MTCKEFIEFLDSIGAVYHYCDNDGKLDQVYVYEKNSYNKRKENLEKNKSFFFLDLFVPYIRVSHFNSTDLYVRDCGWCEYMSEDIVKEKCIELSK